MKHNPYAKVFLFIIAFFIAIGVTQLIAFQILGVPFSRIVSPSLELSLLENATTELLSVITVIALVSLFFKVGDKYNYLKTSLSIKGRKSDILRSSCVTIGMIAIGFLIIWSMGWIKVSLSSIDLTDFLLVTLLFISVSAVEEIVMRGYVLHTLMTGMNKYGALAVSSTLFSLMHLANPNGTFLAFLNLWLAGLFLGIVYVHTKNLWFAITSHFLWNFMQSPVLGFNVSGKELPAFLNIEYVNTDLWTGGEFGFEGSLICTIVSIIAIFWLDVHYKKGNKSVLNKPD